MEKSIIGIDFSSMRCEEKSVKTLLFLLISLLMANCIRGQENVQLSPENLRIVIYPGNNNFAIFHVSLNKNDNMLGYDYVGISTSGKPSKNRWMTRLLIDSRTDKKENLNFAMTIPARAIKEHDKFFLQVDRPLLKSPSEKLPLIVNYESRGFFVFRTAAGDSKKWVRIDLQTNRIELSWEPQKQFDVRWNKDGFDIFSGAAKISTWCWKVDSKIGFRGSRSGISAIYEDNDSVMPFFSRKELFYLQLTRGE